jgi:hypothetical protein
LSRMSLLISPAFRCSLFLLSSRRSIMWSMQAGSHVGHLKDRRIFVSCNCNSDGALRCSERAKRAVKRAGSLMKLVG